jgi:hypothetical protein
MLNCLPRSEIAMIRTLTQPVQLVQALALCTFIPVMMAAVRGVQIPLGTLHEACLRLATVGNWQRYWASKIGGMP